MSRKQFIVVLVVVAVAGLVGGALTDLLRGNSAWAADRDVFADKVVAKQITVTPNGDANEHPRINLFIKDNDEPTIRITDVHGHARLDVRLTEGDRPEILMWRRGGATPDNMIIKMPR